MRLAGTPAGSTASRVPFPLLVLSAIALISAIPQAVALAAQDVPPPTFAAATEVVTVDVLVLDKEGKPVSGLTREDFRVLEDGELQALTAFEVVEAKLPPASADDTAPGTGPPAEAAPFASNTAVPETRRTFGIVFDDLHLDALQIEPVRKALRAFLDRETRPGDRLLLLTTSDGRFQATTGAASDVSFKYALDRVTSQRPSKLDDGLRLNPVEAMRLVAGDTVLANRVRRRRAILSGNCVWLVDRCMCDPQPRGRAADRGPGVGSLEFDGCVEPPGVESPEEAYSRAVRSASRSLEVLREAIAMLGAQRERKVLVLVSSGFFMDPSLHGFREVRDVAARANVVLYFLDARGLETGPGTSGAATRFALPPQDVSATAAVWREEADGARTLAEETGGLSLQTNDFQEALRRIADESRVAYLLGYEPPTARLDGRYHELKVEVLRPGLRVRARAGYFAAKGEKAAPVDAVERALQDPFDRAEVPLRLASYVLGPTPGAADRSKLDVIVAVELKEDALESHVVDGRRLAELRVLLDVGTRDRPTATSEWRLKIPVGSAPRDEARERWHPFATRVPLEPGEHRLRIVAESGGRVGSLTSDLVVPKPDAERLSTPILSDLQATEGRLPILPLASRSFAAADTLHCWLELHGAKAAAETGRARTSTRFRMLSADGREWAAGSFDGIPGAQERTDWLVSVPLATAPEGRNALVLNVRDLVSGREFESREVFRVEPAPQARTEDAGANEAGDSDPVLAALLERAGAYALRYEKTFRNLVADEAYRQVEYAAAGDLTPKRFRNLRSDVAFVPLSGPIPWGTFRDVYDVDGDKVQDRSHRLEELFARPSSSSQEQARAILREGARYNLGDHGMDRTVNAPTVGLLFLLPQNQGRLRFERRGGKTIDGIKTVEVSFEEKTRPTIVRDYWGSDVPASGRVFIDPAHGTVLRTRIEYDIEKSKRIVDPERWARAVVLTEYRREPALDIFVPETMEDWHSIGAHKYLEGRASYSGYRRFQVTADWEVTETKPAAPAMAPPTK